VHTTVRNRILHCARCFLSLVCERVVVSVLTYCLFVFISDTMVRFFAKGFVFACLLAMCAASVENSRDATLPVRLNMYCVSALM